MAPCDDGLIAVIDGTGLLWLHLRFGLHVRFDPTDRPARTATSDVTGGGAGVWKAMEHSPDDIISLGSKLDGIEFTDGERAALHAIIDAARGGADDDEVSGFTAPTFGSALRSLAKSKPPKGHDSW